MCAGEAENWDEGKFLQSWNLTSFRVIKMVTYNSGRSIIFAVSITMYVGNLPLKGFNNCRINSVRKNGLKKRLATAKTVSNRRTFHYVTDARIHQLKQMRLKKNSESNTNWGVTAYVDWRNDRLKSFKYDVGIYEADLENLESLTKENLQHALCHFVPEVTKVKGEGLYPGRTLYQMITAIQRYLVVNKLNWNLVYGPEFGDLKVVLDNVMKERTALNIGVTKRQVGVISYQIENQLWEQNILGEDTPDKLRNTVLFLIGVNIQLRAVEEHYELTA